MTPASNQYQPRRVCSALEIRYSVATQKNNSGASGVTSSPVPTYTGASVNINVANSATRFPNHIRPVRNSSPAVATHNTNVMMRTPMAVSPNRTVPKVTNHATIGG